jgi:hypothetical protein
MNIYWQCFLFMGHQTEEMARRYQHLRADKLKGAILAPGM